MKSPASNIIPNPPTALVPSVAPGSTGLVPEVAAAPTEVTAAIVVSRRRPRAYRWRRLLVLGAAVVVLGITPWLGSLLGGRVVAPAVGTAPVAVAEAAP